MSTILVNPLFLYRIDFVVYLKDSVLPGYHEFHYLSPLLPERAIRVIATDDPRCDDMVRYFVVPHIS